MRSTPTFGLDLAYDFLILVEKLISIFLDGSWKYRMSAWWARCVITKTLGPITSCITWLDWSLRNLISPDESWAGRMILGKIKLILENSRMRGILKSPNKLLDNQFADCSYAPVHNSNFCFLITKSFQLFSRRTAFQSPAVQHHLIVLFWVNKSKPTAPIIVGNRRKCFDFYKRNNTKNEKRITEIEIT